MLKSFACAYGNTLHTSASISKALLFKNYINEQLRTKILNQEL